MTATATASPRRAVFLDRDGTVNEEVHFLSQPDQIELLPTVANTISKLNQCGIAIVVVTNQSGVARGYIPEKQLDVIHTRLSQLLAEQNALIDGVYYCPHHPTEGIGQYHVDCDCRKPMPGMLLRAARELNLDLSRSLMIGDRISDLEAGANAGCETALVRTGYGHVASVTINLPAVRGIGVFSTVEEAVTEWLNQSTQ